MISRADAEILVSLAQSHAREFTRLLKQIHDERIWQVLGYPSFRAFVDERFDESLSTIYRLIRRERGREALNGRVNVTRFTDGALEQLVDVSDDTIRALADIASRSTDERIGADTVKVVQAACADTLVTGAVELADGSQVPVTDALADGVRGVLREDVLSKREYIVANVPVKCVSLRLIDLTLTLGLETSASYNALSQVANIDQIFRISIWREAE